MIAYKLLRDQTQQRRNKNPGAATRKKNGPPGKLPLRTQPQMEKAIRLAAVTAPPMRFSPPGQSQSHHNTNRKNDNSNHSKVVGISPGQLFIPEVQAVRFPTRIRTVSNCNRLTTSHNFLQESVCHSLSIDQIRIGLQGRMKTFPLKRRFVVHCRDRLPLW